MKSAVAIKYLWNKAYVTNKFADQRRQRQMVKWRGIKHPVDNTALLRHNVYGFTTYRRVLQLEHGLE
jgi:hypothetical protein